MTDLHGLVSNACMHSGTMRGADARLPSPVINVSRCSCEVGARRWGCRDCLIFELLIVPL